MCVGPTRSRSSLLLASFFSSSAGRGSAGVANGAAAHAAGCGQLLSFRVHTLALAYISNRGDMVSLCLPAAFAALRSSGVEQTASDCPGPDAAPLLSDVA